MSTYIRSATPDLQTNERTDRLQPYYRRDGAPRPMKMGTIASPCRYDAATADTIRLENRRHTAIPRYASRAAALPTSSVVRSPSDCGHFSQFQERCDGPASCAAAKSDLSMISSARRSWVGAISMVRSMTPSVPRYSILTLRPSTQPSSPIRRTKAARRGMAIQRRRELNYQLGCKARNYLELFDISCQGMSSRTAASLAEQSEQSVRDRRREIDALRFRYCKTGAARNTLRSSPR
jgi:hypothetical protein